MSFMILAVAGVVRQVAPDGLMRRKSGSFSRETEATNLRFRRCCKTNRCLPKTAHRVRPDALPLTSTLLTEQDLPCPLPRSH